MSKFVSSGSKRQGSIVPSARSNCVGEKFLTEDQRIAGEPDPAIPGNVWVCHEIGKNKYVTISVPASEVEEIASTTNLPEERIEPVEETGEIHMTADERIQTFPVEYRRMRDKALFY